jgi:hypothetical protein
LKFIRGSSKKSGGGRSKDEEAVINIDEAVMRAKQMVPRHPEFQLPNAADMARERLAGGADGNLLFHIQQDFEFNGVTFFIMIPEVFERDALLEDGDKWLVKDPFGNAVPGMVKVLCPTCKVNTYVKTPDNGGGGYTISDKVSAYSYGSLFVLSTC